MHEAAPHLDGSYAAFGKVIDGIKAVDDIAEEYTDSMDRPYEKQTIKSIRVETFGQSYPEPEKVR